MTHRLSRFPMIAVIVLVGSFLVLGCIAEVQPECHDELRCVLVDADEPITIAALMVLSGPNAAYGVDSKGAVQIALADYGQILGHDIRLLEEDSSCSPEGGQTGAQKLASEYSVAGIVGTACSSAATAALPVISEAGLTMISPANTAPTLTDPDKESGGTWQPGYYRTVVNDSMLGPIAAQFMYEELGARTLATIHDGSAYAFNFQRVTAEEFTKLGGEVTYQGAVNVGDTDTLPLLTEIATMPPDIIFYPIFLPESSLITVQSKQVAGLENTVLMAGDLLLESFVAGTGLEDSHGVLTPGPVIEGEEYQELLRKWEDMHGGLPPSAFHAQAYDATYLLLNAIKNASVEDGRGGLVIGLQAIRDYLNNVRAYDGISGTLSCTPTGDCATSESLAVFQIDTRAEDGPKLNVVYRPG